MNKLEEKAAELIALAKDNGLEAASRKRGEDIIDIEYFTKRARIQTLITYTETGRVKVDTWEWTAKKRETVPAKYLGDLFYSVARSEERHALKEARN
jgi:hypothetical protein